MAEGVETVEVVGVDDQEWLVDEVFGDKHCVTGSPRFFSFGEFGYPFDRRIQFLESEDYFYFVVKSAMELIFEILFDGFADDDDDLTETCSDCVVDGIFDNCFSRGSNGIGLFQASVAAADAGGEDQ